MKKFDDLVDDSLSADQSGYLPNQAMAGKATRDPASQVMFDDLVADGSTMSFDDLVSDESKYETPVEQLKAGLENVASTATFGLSTGLETALGVNPEDIRGRKEAHERLQPILSGAETIAGLFVPGGAGKVIGKAGAAVAGLVGEGLGLGQSVARTAARFGAENALMQSGDEVAKYFSESPEQSTESAVANIGLSGLIGSSIGAPFGVVSPAWRALKGSELVKGLTTFKDQTTSGGMGGITKKTISSLTGVSEDTIEKYLKNREEINASPEFREVYDFYLPKIEEIHNSVFEKKIASSEAKTMLDDVSKSFKEDLRQKGYELGIANQMSKQALKTAQVEVSESLHQGAMNAAPKIVQAVEGLRDRVVQQSAKAYEVLENTSEPVSMGGFFKKGRELIADIQKEATPEAMQMASRLDEYLSNVGEMSENYVLNPVEVKKLIQGLDKVSKYDFNASMFDKGLSRYYKQLRYTLDDEIKAAIPAYKEAMKPLAKDTALLSKLTKYGDEFSATKKVSSLKRTENFKTEMPLLKELEQRSGSAFLQDVEKYSDKSIKESLVKNLPEFSESKKIADALRQLKNPETLRAIEDRIKKTPEYLQYQSAIREFEDAVASKEQLGGISPANLEAKLKAAMRGKFNVEKAIESLPEFKGKNIYDVLENIKAKDELTGGTTRGSRNVNLFGGLAGGAAGMLGGHILGGIAGGAAIGSFMDRYGHEVAKKILDAYIDNHKGLTSGLVVSNKGAIRLALAKVLDSDKEISATAFKGMVHLIDESIKGEKETKKNAKSIFNGSKMNIRNIEPEKIKKLNEGLLKAEKDPQSLVNVGGDVSHYSPDHAGSIGKLAASATLYLNSQRPKTIQLSPLDSKIEPSKAEKLSFERTLTIAQNPLAIMEHIKDGTILPTDIQTLKTIYPAFYDKISQELLSAMTDHLTDGESIPYKTKQSLSMFLGQPLDSTMKPESIQSIQAMYIGKKQQQAAAPTTKSVRNTSKMGEISKDMQTQTQNAEKNRLND